MLRLKLPKQKLTKGKNKMKASTKQTIKEIKVVIPKVWKLATTISMIAGAYILGQQGVIAMTVLALIIGTQGAINLYKEFTK